MRFVTALMMASFATAPAFAEPAATAAAPTVAKFTVDMPIETLVADPAAKAALEASLPNLTAHPMYEQFKSMSLTQLQPMAPDKITDETIAKVKAALAEIK